MRTNLYRKNMHPQSYAEANTHYSLQLYFKDLKQYHLLSREQEKELAIRIKQYNDPVAETDLIQANLRLVVKIANDYKKKFHFHLQDLIQEGNVGLTRAVRKFDPDKNVKFSIYASYWIKAYILRFMMENWSIVKIGTTQKQRILFFNLYKVKQKLRESKDRDIDISQFHLFKNKGINNFDINEMDQRLNKGDESLNSPIVKNSKQEKLESIPENAMMIDEQVSNKEIRENLKQAISEFRKKLNPRELEIFDLRMVSDSPLTLRKLGEKYGISRERVRQVEKRIYNRLKEYIINHCGDKIE
jgi:RNA polymerase sigma-32 factor